MEEYEYQEENMNESDIERQVEEFRKKLERVNNTESKKKIKPNISNDWLKELRRRLNSVSTEENSVERKNTTEPSQRNHKGGLEDVKNPRAMSSF